MTFAYRPLLAASALVLAVTTLATGCSGSGSDPVALGIHGVAATYVPPLANADLTTEEALATLDFEVTESATAAMDWFIAGDCSTAPPVTEEFAVACDEQGTLYFMGPAQLTQDDVASATVLDGGGITLTFTDAAATTLATLTAGAAIAPAPANQVAIVVDGTVITAPAVQEEITTGSVEIRSESDDRDWDAMAASLNAAAAG